MYISTLDYNTALLYWDQAEKSPNSFQVWEDVTVGDRNRKYVETHHDAVYTVRTNSKEAFAAMLTYDVGIGDNAFISLQKLFNTKYVFYKSNSHVVKDS